MSLPDVHAVARPALATAIPRPSIRVGERAALFGLSLVLYLAIAFRVVVMAGLIVGDAWSRVGNAAYMIASRDPHLAAVGFVWNPLPSLAMLPLVAIRGVWPPLVTEGFAANIVSALFMAGTVAVVADIGRDLRMPRPLRLAFVALFALHPMIALYGANGMSEAPFLFFLLVAVRHALRWFDTLATADLATLGLALGGAYLTRYEAIAAAAAVLPIVVLRRLATMRGDRSERRMAVAADLALALTPFVVAFVGWSVASLVITGSPFETFTSVYGNSSQVALARGYITNVTGHGLDALLYFASQLLALAPGLPVVAALAVAWAGLRRRPSVLARMAPLLILAGVLAFSGVAALTASSFAWLRFAITAIPLVLVATMILVADVLEARPLTVMRRFVVGIAIPAAALAALGLAFPVALDSMTNPRLGREEQGQVAAIAGKDVSGEDNVRVTAVAADVARYLDALELPNGSVVTDVAIAFPIVLQSDDMRQFVITPDRDFARVVADPAIFHVRYLLVPSGNGYSMFDAVGRAHPSLYESGAGIGTLVRQFGDGVFGWRLYAVKGSGPG